MTSSEQAPAATPKKTSRTTSKTAATKATVKPKPVAQSLHIGLNAVSPAHYGGWSGDLAACEADAADMQAIAKAKGMKPTVLLTAKADRGDVRQGMNQGADDYLTKPFTKDQLLQTVQALSSLKQREV